MQTTVNTTQTEKSYSIVEARNQFAALVRDAEQSAKPVRVTRHGKPVVVILSMEEYQKMRQPPQRDWMTDYLAWRAQWGVDDWDDDFDPWADVRDKSAGREDNPWL